MASKSLMSASQIVAVRMRDLSVPASASNASILPRTARVWAAASSPGAPTWPRDVRGECAQDMGRSEEHTSELQTLMRSSYAVFCLTKKTDRNAAEQLYQPVGNQVTDHPPYTRHLAHE